MRHKVFIDATENLNAKIVDENVDPFFNDFKYAAKTKIAFAFILRNTEDGGFRFFYAHEKSTLLDRSKLFCTRDNLAKLKDFLNKSDVKESGSRKSMNTMWRFWRLTNLKAFATLFEDFPLGCKVAVLPKLLFKIHAVNCLAYEEKTRHPDTQSFNPFVDLIFFNGTSILEQNLIFCSKRVKNVHAMNVYQTQETLLDKLHSSGVEDEWANTLQNLSYVRPWIDLRAKIKLQRHRYKKMDWKACSHRTLHFPNSCERANFPLQLWSSSFG